jgi:hypothetical protein
MRRPLAVRSPACLWDARAGQGQGPRTGRVQGSRASVPDFLSLGCRCPSLPVHRAHVGSQQCCRIRSGMGVAPLAVLIVFCAVLGHSPKHRPAGHPPGLRGSGPRLESLSGGARRCLGNLSVVPAGCDGVRHRGRWGKAAETRGASHDWRGRGSQLLRWMPSCAHTPHHSAQGPWLLAFALRLVMS